MQDIINQKICALTFAVMIIFCLNSSKLLSLDKDSSTPLLDFYKNEKMRIDPKVLEEMLKTGKIPDLGKSMKKDKHEQIQSNYDVPASLSSDAESEIHAAINPNDTNNIIISGIRNLVNPYSDLFESIICPIHYTTDFGKSWQTSDFKTVPMPGTTNEYLILGGGDPMIAFDKNGKAYMSWINLYAKLNGSYLDSVYSAVNWASTTDGGANWFRANNYSIKYLRAKYSTNILLDLGGMHDKQWMAVDNSNSQYQGTLYTSLTWIYFTQTYQQNTMIQVLKKPAGSQEFLKDSAIAQKANFKMTQFTNLDVDKNGELHLIYFGSINNKSSIYYTKSTDGGTSFATEKKISDFVLNGAQMLPGSSLTDSIVGVSTSRLYPCPQIAVDKSNKTTSGNIYATWTANGISKTENNGYDIYLSASTDGGSSWSTPIIVNNDTKNVRSDQYYSSISVNDEGVVCLGWYDRRMDTANINTHYFVSASFDGGKTFRNQTNVSSMATDFTTINEIARGFGIGEYNAMLSTKGYAIPVWSDGRTNDGDLNIYAAFVPLGNLSSVDKIVPINSTFELFEPTPNPANMNFETGFRVKDNSQVKLMLFDMNGNTIKTIVNDKFAEGSYNYSVQTVDVPAGVYYLKLIVNNVYSVRKVIISK